MNPGHLVSFPLSRHIIEKKIDSHVWAGDVVSAEFIEQRKKKLLGEDKELCQTGCNTMHAFRAGSGVIGLTFLLLLSPVRF